MTNRYIAIARRYNGTLDNLSEDWHWDGKVFDRRDQAISDGFEAFGSDDFNVGVLGADGRLVGIDWMTDVVDNEPEVLAPVNAYLSLPGRAR